MKTSAQHIEGLYREAARAHKAGDSDKATIARGLAKITMLETAISRVPPPSFVFATEAVRARGRAAGEAKVDEVDEAVFKRALAE